MEGVYNKKANKMKKLIFLDIEEFKKLKDSDKKNIILLDYLPKDFSDLSLKSIEKFNIEEFFPASLLKNIKKRYEELFNEFYKIVDKKIIYKDVDLFFVIKNDLFLSFYKYVKYMDILNYIIKKNNPKEIFIKYNESKEENKFLDNPELSVSIIKEICYVKKIPLKIKIIKNKKRSINKNLKTYLINILGVLQNMHFKIMNLKRSKKKNILFVGGKNAYLPLLKDMKGKVKITRCGTSVGQAFFDNDQDYYITFWNKPKIKNVKLYKSKIIKNLRSMKYKGISFYNIFLPDLNYLFDAHFKILMRWIDKIYKIEPHISTVVTTNDTLTLEQIIIKILKKNKKKSYVIQHGYTTLSEGFFPLIKNKMLADKMFVWGKTSKEWMVKEGLKKENLIITGSIKFDEYIEDGGIIDLKRKFNISKNKKIIFFIPEANNDLICHLSHKELPEFYRILFSTVNKMKEFILFVKLHPSDKYLKLPEEILREEKADNVSILEKNFPLKPLLKQSDLIISLGSTVTLEAMFFKKPILIANFFNKESIVPFVENNMCVGINNKNKLKQYIINSIKNSDELVKKYEKRFKDYVLIDGNAHKKMSNIILNRKI